MRSVILRSLRSPGGLKGKDGRFVPIKATAERGAVQPAYRFCLVLTVLENLCRLRRASRSADTRHQLSPNAAVIRGQTLGTDETACIESKGFEMCQNGFSFSHKYTTVQRYPSLALSKRHPFAACGQEGFLAGVIDIYMPFVFTNMDLRIRRLTCRNFPMLLEF